MPMEEHVKAALADSAAALSRLSADVQAIQAIAAAGHALAKSFAAGGRAFSCGNGGSMADAIHFAEELTGRFRDDRRGYAAAAISDPGHLPCVANDLGYDEVFARYVESHGRRGDCLLAISTSGKSPNVLRAAEAARALGMMVIALTGRRDSPLGARADFDLCTPGGDYSDRVQELHIKVIHILIELVERELAPENYAGRAAR
jgi:D-sedoheptulose 7-phosphate isomerase